MPTVTNIKTLSPQLFLAVVIKLVCYADFLGRKEENVKEKITQIINEKIKTPSADLNQAEVNISESRKKEHIRKQTKVPLEESSKTEAKISEDRNKLEDTLTIAYYLSRVDKSAVKELGYASFSTAFRGVAEILGQKPATIKNMRDEFDPYFDNGRKGWHSRAMSPSRQAVYDKMANVTDEELTIIVKAIISAYETEPEIVPKMQNGHKRIKISSGRMKEIQKKK